MHPYCGHVVTGDIGFVKHKALRNLLTKGPFYREPRTFDFDKSIYISNVELILYKWIKKEKLDIVCFNG